MKKKNKTQGQGNRFYTQLDMAMCKKEESIYNSELKRNLHKGKHTDIDIAYNECGGVIVTNRNE